MWPIRAANVLNGVDKDCRVWVRTYREPVAADADNAEGVGRRRDRENRRRRRA